MKDVYERLSYATETFYKAMEAHREWRKSKRGRNYLKKHPISSREIIETLKCRYRYDKART